MKQFNVPTSSQSGHTLLEMVMAMSAATILMGGLCSAVVVSSLAFRPEKTAVYAKNNSATAESDLLVDLRLATGFTERTPTATTFFVPDRDGDGRQESLRYAWSGSYGAPLTLSYNGSAPIVVASDVRNFALNYVTKPLLGTVLPAEQTGSSIAMLVNDSSSPSAGEQIQKSIFESWNFRVVIVGINDGDDTILKVAASAKAVYLSGSIESSKLNIGPELAGLGVGIVNAHPDLVDDIGFAAEAANAFSLSAGVADNSHYITSGLSTGNATIAMLPINQIQLITKLSPNLNSLATVNGSPALATIDPGKMLYDGRTAAGRRVMIPWASAEKALNVLNNSGLKLTQNAMEWATGLGNVSSEIKIFGYETIFDSSNGTSNVQYTTKAVLVDNAKLLSISAYVGGANDQVRFAIYSDKGGQPDKLLVESNVGQTATAMEWVTLPVPSTTLSPGNYWLSFSFKNSKQRYRYITSYSGAGERNKSNAAVANGFLENWGNSNNSYNGARSIYATYEVIP